MTRGILVGNIDAILRIVAWPGCIVIIWLSMPHKNDGHFGQPLQDPHPRYLYHARSKHPFIMAQSSFAVFVVSDKITVDVRFQERLFLQCS